MGVDARVPSGARQVLILSVRDVLPGPVVAVLLCQAEIDEEQLVAVSADTHEEVVWFDVSVDEVLVVDVLDSADHLVCQHQDCLHGEAARAKVEEVFKRRSKKVHH